MRRAVPLRGGEPLTLSYSCEARGTAYTAQVFGRVDDERIACIVLRWCPGTGIEDDFRCWELPEEAFFRVDGKRHVLCDAPEVGMNGEMLQSEDVYKWNSYFIDDLTALACDEAGRLLETEDVPDFVRRCSGK